MASRKWRNGKVPQNVLRIVQHVTTLREAEEICYDLVVATIDSDLLGALLALSNSLRV